MKILLASFYTPGIRAMEHLIQEGLQPRQIRLLTHEMERNRSLMAFAAAQGIEMKTLPVRSQSTLQWIEEFQADVLFSLYYRDVIPGPVLDLFPLGAVNLHPSLLPKYRGTFSAPWTIINSEEHTGFTYHRMVTRVDAGNIILQRRVPIQPGDTGYSLYHRLIVEGMAAFPQVLDLVVHERFEGEPQVGEPSYFAREVPFAGIIDPHWSVEQVDRFIRAMYFPPFKGAVVRSAGGEEQEIGSLEEYLLLRDSGQLLIE